jgi:hypothetical protein
MAKINKTGFSEAMLEHVAKWYRIEDPNFPFHLYEELMVEGERLYCSARYDELWNILLGWTRVEGLHCLK